jgi:hypothetical protein
LLGFLGEAAQAIFSPRSVELADSLAHLAGWGTALGLWGMVHLGRSTHPDARVHRIGLFFVAGMLILVWSSGYLATLLRPEVQLLEPLKASDAIVRQGNYPGVYLKGLFATKHNGLTRKFHLLLAAPRRPLQRVYVSGPILYNYAVSPHPGLNGLVVMGNPYSQLAPLRYDLRLMVAPPGPPVLLVDSRLRHRPDWPVEQGSATMAVLCTEGLGAFADVRTAVHQRWANVPCVMDMTRANNPLATVSWVVSLLKPTAESSCILLTADASLTRQTLKLPPQDGIVVWLIDHNTPRQPKANRRLRRLGSLRDLPAIE